MTTTLKLKDEQRSEMDTLWSRFTQQQAVDQRGEVEARKQFEQLLAVGDWTGARAAVAERARHTSAIAAGQSNVQIEILSRLSPEQLQTFTAKYSAFLHRPWGGTFGINLSGRQAASIADDVKE